MLSCLALLCASAQAEIRQCEKLTSEQQDQAQWCATHVACRVVIDVLTTCRDITAATKRIYEQVHDSGADVPKEGGLTESERRAAALARLDRQPAAERKALLAKCLDYRGESGTDVCYEQFAGSEEISERRRAEQARAIPIAWDARDKADIQQFQAADLRLVNDLLDAHCEKAGKGNPAECAAITEKAVALQRRLALFENDVKGRRKPGDRLLTMPVLRSPTLAVPQQLPVPAPSGAAGAPSTSGVANAASSAPGAALVAALPVRVANPQDTIFAAVVAQVDAKARPRDAAAAKERTVRAAAERQELAERAAAEARAQVAQAERTRQAAADAAMIERGSIGEVYALADRLESGGEADAARTAYRVLVRRFPDHPLAASAAGRLAVLGGAGNARAGATSTSATPVTSASGGGDCEAQFAAMVADFRRPVWAQPASRVEMNRGIMYMTQQSLQLGNGACKGSHHEAELVGNMQAAYDAARTACVALASDTSTCTPQRRD